jgi:hypothetical protein
VLAARNEWGKSTVLRALTRALLRQIQLAVGRDPRAAARGSSLSPRVGVIFEAAGQRYRLQKTFLEKKSSELFRAGAGAAWERTDDSDRADQRVRELLGAPKLEGRTVKPETWGLLRYLWVGRTIHATGRNGIARVAKKRGVASPPCRSIRTCAR